MKRAAKGIFRTLSIIIASLVMMVILLYSGVYVALLTPSVQDRLRHEGEKFLSDFLKTEVSIGSVTISPFDQLVLRQVTIPDQQGDSLIAIDRLGAGISLRHLIADRRIVVTHGDIDGLHGRITRPDKNSPTNLQFIIDAFKPKDNQPPKPFDVVVHTVVIRNSDITYDVLNAPRKAAGLLDPNHLAVHNLRADIDLPRLRNNDFDIVVKRLAAAEKSGLEIKRLTTHVCITDTALQATGIKLELPHSQLQVGDIALSYSSLKTLGDEVKNMSHRLQLTADPITPSDLKSLVPQLQAWNEPVKLNTQVHGTIQDIAVEQLQLNMGDGRLALDFKGTIQNIDHPDRIAIHTPHITLKASAADVNSITSRLPGMSAQARDILSRLGDIALDAKSDIVPGNIHFNGGVTTSLGHVDLDGIFAQKSDKNTKQFAGHVNTPHLQLGRLLGKTDLLGDVALNADVDLTLQGKDLSGTLDGHINFVDIKQRRLHDITADITAQDNTYSGRLAINDALGRMAIEGKAVINGPETTINADITANNINTAQLGVLPKFHGHKLSFNAQADLRGNSLANIDGMLNINDLQFVNPESNGLLIDEIAITAANDGPSKRIDIASDYLNGHIEGEYDYRTIVPTVKSMLCTAFPKYFAAAKLNSTHQTNVNFDFKLTADEKLEALLKLPIKLVENTTLRGFIDERSGNMEVKLNAPYLLQGNKIIEGTTIVASIDSASSTANLHASTLIPNKKGKIAVNIDATGANNRLDANLGWRVMREHDFHGDINLSALMARHEDQGLDVTIDINPTQLVFNDTIWQIDPGQVTIDRGVITVDNLVGHSDKQYVHINGKVSRDPDDELNIDLNDVSLDYVFETLNIDNVHFGGRATGHFFASDLLSGAPRLSTPGLQVVGLRYNNALMGDADIKSHWMNDEKAVALNADLAQANGKHSYIDGAIFVADDSLYLDFKTERANIAFMKPFMAAFAEDVKGEVSGHAVLFGNFHTINLKGDVLADSLQFKIGYTNVSYSCAGDSVHFVPDLITFNNVRIHDRDGHEARMDGWLRHDAFHNPVFNFAITQAKDLLCYDTNASINPDWYGTIYGNGSAFITGEPGMVDIKVNMETAPRSTFTFVLSDTEEANDYNFITFRDRDKKETPPEPVVEDTVPEIVRRLTAQVKKEEQSQPTHYAIDLQGDITPNAQLILVMDPVGGDRIKAKGQGNMRMTYNDADEMTIYGKYTLEHGDYNFTLQDIIIKDFIISDGSSISFQGDPYAATLDIKAVYSLNANLRDLDESFAQDKEINRTTVPVHAILKAKGAINQPDIDFDLEFPTLTSDTYRKVKSIINTDDMMNRQIIYLLALNRFYTPEYLNNGTNRNNELTSVASSTISSQLANILGKMSDKLSIAPNFRSDKGDFSDMEVDLALSSQLLNNRLLLNGNFGYRDNTYNTRNTNFIGDFDIEYLLNAKGTLRLKAYNHFNDQNYYVRNALTTQGVGVVFKHDFDKPSSTLKPKLKATSVADTLPQQSAQNTKKP